MTPVPAAPRTGFFACLQGSGPLAGNGRTTGALYLKP
jgi:hypothetical protein